MKGLNPYIRSLLICIPICLLMGVFVFHEHTIKDITFNIVVGIFVAITVTSSNNNRGRRIKRQSAK
jgi:hypothetical protein